jgi:hypothetical protein
MASNAYNLLSDWNKIPGVREHGEIDAGVLDAWIDEARALATEKSRLEVADSHIGKLLAQYPEVQVGQWPPDSICCVIDRINTKSIRSGFYSGIFNKHSFSSRGVFDGGDRERKIAARFKQLADTIFLKWPATASIFQSLMDTYLHDAARQDEEAQKDSLEY